MAAFSIRGKLLLDGELEVGALVIERGRITDIERSPRGVQLPEPVIEAALVAPGLIDLQVNGGFGVEVGPDPEAFRRLAAELPSTGVTGFVPTVVSSPPECYPQIHAAFDAARGARGARLQGLHFEGPFLSPQRIGAHRREVIEQAQPALIEEFLRGADLRLVTLAPELPNALDWIGRFRDHGVVVSLGHTNATAEEFTRGVDAGATMATHLYNAMSPFEHRAPNAIGAALVDDRVTCGLIVDGIHSHPLSTRLAIRLKGVERLCLVTDMMSAAGMPHGHHTLFGKKVVVDETSARLEDGTLAGSIITMDETIRNTVRWGGVTAGQALTMATEVPARLLGLRDTGRLAVGSSADLVLMDDALAVMATFVRGEEVYARGR